jgi:hypothetical protein
MFLQQFLHRRHVQHLIGDDPLQLGVLDLKLLEALGLTRFKAAVRRGARTSGALRRSLLRHA